MMPERDLTPSACAFAGAIILAWGPTDVQAAAAFVLVGGAMAWFFGRLE